MSELQTNQAMTSAALGFRPPRVGELYVNTGNDRVCVVEGDDGQRYTGNQRWRRVRIRYVDTGNRTRVHLYRWDLSSVPAGAFPTYPRMLRLYPGVRVTKLKRTVQEGRQRCTRWHAFESHVREAFSGVPPSGLYRFYEENGHYILEEAGCAKD